MHYTNKVRKQNIPFFTTTSTISIVFDKMEYEGMSVFGKSKV